MIAFAFKWTKEDPEVQENTNHIVFISMHLFSLKETTSDFVTKTKNNYQKEERNIILSFNTIYIKHGISLLFRKLLPYTRRS